MLTQIIQKRFFIERKATILENKIEYESNYFGRKLGATVSFEDLTNSRDSYFQSKLNILIAVAFCFLFTFVCIIYRDEKDFDPNAWIFWGICLVISGIAYFLTIERLWKVKIQNNTFLFFFKSSPSESEVDHFLQTLFETRDTYLRETYFSEPSKLISYESQKNNLQWMRKIDAINKREFESSKKQLDEIFIHDSRKIGFN